MSEPLFNPKMRFVIGYKDLELTALPDGSCDIDIDYVEEAASIRLQPHQVEVMLPSSRARERNIR